MTTISERGDALMEYLVTLGVVVSVSILATRILMPAIGYAIAFLVQFVAVHMSSVT